MTLVLPDFEAEVVSSLLLPLLTGSFVRVCRPEDFRQMTRLLELLGVRGVSGCLSNPDDQIIWRPSTSDFEDDKVFKSGVITKEVKDYETLENEELPEVTEVNICIWWGVFTGIMLHTTSV